MNEEPTVYEVMAATVSHELRDFERWFLGLATGEETILLLSHVPLVGMALAQHTHAPNSVMSVAGWGLNPVLNEMPTLESEIPTTTIHWRCEAHITMSAPFHPFATKRGDVDVGFASAAHVDKYGNCNTVCIGDYHQPKIRLIGPVNQPLHFSCFGREIIIMPHEKRNFVDRVDFISGVGYLDGPEARARLGFLGSGPVMILTNKAVFDFDPKTKLARLKSLHPGVSLEDTRGNTGYVHNFMPKKVAITPQPTPEELRIIREVIDPRGVLLPR